MDATAPWGDDRRRKLLDAVRRLSAFSLVAGFCVVIFGLPGAGASPWAW